MSRSGDHLAQRHPGAAQTTANRERRARWITGVGLAAAAAVTIGLLASAQTGGSSGGVATLDPTQTSSLPGGVSAADLGSRALEPGPPTTVARAISR